jgi:hypothetical protein
MQHLKIKDLEFGLNVFQGDVIPENPKSDALTVINNEQGLDSLKNRLDNDLDVIMDRTKPYHGVFEIPSFVESRLEYQKIKGEYIRKSYNKLTNTSLS